MSKKIDGLSVPKPVEVMACDSCAGGHTTIECPIVGAMHGPTNSLILLVVPFKLRGIPTVTHIIWGLGIALTSIGVIKGNSRSLHSDFLLILSQIRSPNLRMS